MLKDLFRSFKESSFAILPIVIALVILNFAIPTLELNAGTKFGPILVSLLISIIPLILGTTLFAIGAEKSVAKLGSIVGSTLTKRKTLVALFVIAFLLGVLATIAEPDLAVLASRTGGSQGKDWSLVIAAAIGVGVFLIIGIIRILNDKSLKYWVAIGYGLVFSLGCIADKNIFSIVFDAGGVTTGVVTVPFLIALGVSVANILGGKKSADDSFGFSGLCSLGTVLFVMLYMVIFRNFMFETGSGTINGMEKIQSSLQGISADFPTLDNYLAVGELYQHEVIVSLKNVSLSMTPLIGFFIIFNFFAKIKGKELFSIIIGFVYTFVGLVLFFLGAESGFIPFAFALGRWFGGQGTDALWLLVLIGCILGFISMLAEPAVKVLADTVKEVSRGVVSNSLIYIALGFATAIAITLNAVRVTFDIDIIYFIVPLFLLAIAMTFISPEIYVGIALDAAGVATGTMASCFFLPLFIGYTSIIYPETGLTMMRNGFGVVGLMSVMPIIAMEIIGILTVSKEKIAYRKALLSIKEFDDSQIIHLPLELIAEEN